MAALIKYDPNGTLLFLTKRDGEGISIGQNNPNTPISIGTVSSDTTFVSSIVSQQHIRLDDITAPSNPSDGQGFLYKKNGDDGLFWKPDSGGSEIDLTSMGGGGEVNTASNIGTNGIGVFDSKSGFDLQFRNINPASNKISVLLDAVENEIDIDVNETNIDHDNLLNFVANEHVDHSTVTLTAGEGLSGGGDITASRTFDIDVNGLTSTTPVLGDELAIYDVSAAGHRKITLTQLQTLVDTGEVNTASNIGVGGVGVFNQKVGADLQFRNINAGSSKITVTDDAGNNEIDIDLDETVIDHDNLLNFVVNEHIDHSAVVLTAGEGLTGGGDITTNRTFDLDFNNLATEAAPVLADEIAIYDVSEGAHNKITLTQLQTLIDTDSGEVNTASNQGAAGVGVFIQKTGSDLEFKNINTGSSKVTITNDVANNEIDVDVDETAINHDNLLNFEANEHIDHSSVVLTAGQGLTGGGDITTNRTFDLDINGLINEPSPVSTDEIAIYDISVGAHRKITISALGAASGGEENTASNQGTAGVGVFLQKTGVDLEFKNINNGSNKITVTNDIANNEIDIDVDETNIVHDNLSGFVVNEHIDHTSVVLTAGEGLVGGGDITTGRTFDIDVNGLTSTTPVLTDELVIYNTSVSGHRKITLTQLQTLIDTDTGEVNTASNIGTAGVGVFDQKVGSDLQFRNINNGSNKISITNDNVNNEIDVDVVETNIVHDNLSGFVANEHIDHSTVTLTAGEGLVGGGDITTNRTFDIDVNGLSSTTPVLGDKMVIYDSSLSGHRKITLTQLQTLIDTGEVNTASNEGTAGVGVFIQKTGSNLEFKNINAGSNKISITNDGANNEIDIDVDETNIVHDNLSGFVANEHIDHSVVNINAGQGLTGGGNITTSRTISIDVNGLTTEPTLAQDDEFVIYDVSEGAHNKVTLSQITGGFNGSDSVGVFTDEKPQGTNGGTFSNNAWRTRDLNTSSGNLTGTSLSGNQVTLPAGSYLIEAMCPAKGVNSHQIRLRNITDGVTSVTGNVNFSDRTGSKSGNYAYLKGFVTIASSKVFEVQHQCSNSSNSDGFGVAAGFGVEVYTILQITKIAN